MKLPELSELSTSRDLVEIFGGYNHNLRINEGEFYDMQNLTSTYYPVLAPRKQRGKSVQTAEDVFPVGLIDKNGLCYVTASNGRLYFVMEGESYDLGETLVDHKTTRSLTSMGAYVIVMPDKKYINTLDTQDRGEIETTYQSPEGVAITFTLCKMDGTEYKVDKTGPDEPDTETIANGYTWLDTSQTPNSLKQYSKDSGMWSAVATTYLKIGCQGIGEKFEQYDGVDISGVTIESLKDTVTGSMVVYAKGDDYLVVTGLIEGSVCVTQTDQITVERRMPAMDFVVESNNRLWGCRYGKNNKGNIVNELYACKLGDFKNWNCFMGISTDSYYVSLGTDGDFTGAISYLGYPLFFKENCLHTVYGNYPAEYQVQDTACRGVQKGSEKSLAMVNEVLYYKSRTGICAYSGALPTEVSAALGEKSYSNAVACYHKGKYYVSMKDVETEDHVLFVCDTKKGLWHKEDALQVKDFCSIGDEIYYLDTEPHTIKNIFGSDAKDEAPVAWMAETGIIGCTSPDKRYISRISIKMSIDIGATVLLSIQYDSSGVWETASMLTGYNLKTFTLPIRPKRCDHFKLRFEGIGEAKIFSISKITEQGSDV
ncbi:MAG: hypothetical protein IJO75_01705 [Clostridia bacterium]|nr:hypothetical protein [Clostridia bacterium]